MKYVKINSKTVKTRIDKTKYKNGVVCKNT